MLERLSGNTRKRGGEGGANLEGKNDGGGEGSSKSVLRQESIWLNRSQGKQGRSQGGRGRKRRGMEKNEEEGTAWKPQPARDIVRSHQKRSGSKEGNNNIGPIGKTMYGGKQMEGH